MWLSLAVLCFGNMHTSKHNQIIIQGKISISGIVKGDVKIHELNHCWDFDATSNLYLKYIKPIYIPTSSLCSKNNGLAENKVNKKIKININNIFIN